jgi:hypothetical protein
MGASKEWRISFKRRHRLQTSGHGIKIKHVSITYVCEGIVMGNGMILKLMFACGMLAAVAVAQDTTKVATPDLSGSWSGTWQSDSSGHHGPMNARFESSGDGSYRVTFTGRFFKVFPFRYTANLQVTGVEGGKVVLEGSQRLIGFGTFQYHATANADHFTATYQARRDHGQFLLTRSR